MKTITSNVVAERIGRRHPDLLTSIRVWFRDEPNEPRLIETSKQLKPLTVIAKHYELTVEHCTAILSHIRTEKARAELQKIINELSAECSQASQTPNTETNSAKKATRHKSSCDLSEQPPIECAEKPEFGELHTATFGGKTWYCVSDVCRCLGLLIREGEDILNRNSHVRNEFIFRRKKIAMSYVFTDTDGLLSLIIESRKNKANPFRRWIEREICQPQKDVAVSLPVTTTQEGIPQTAKLLPPPEHEHPTLKEYFTDYVPATEFCQIILQLISASIAHANTLSVQVADEYTLRRDIVAKAHIMRTFHDALKYNYTRPEGL